MTTQLECLLIDLIEVNDGFWSQVGIARLRSKADDFGQPPVGSPPPRPWSNVRLPPLQCGDLLGCECQQWAEDVRHSKVQMPFDARFLNETPYIKGMNRRRFIQSLVAVFSLPANPTLSLQSVTTALPTAAAVPAHARSWAVYMSTLHGECTPRALQNLLNIPEIDAKRYVSRLIADGVLKPNPLLQRSVSEIVKTIENSPLDKVKRRLDMKARAEPEQLENRDPVDAIECLDNGAEMSEDIPEVDPAVLAEDETAEEKTQVPKEGMALHDRLAGAADPRD